MTQKTIYQPYMSGQREKENFVVSLDCLVQCIVGITRPDSFASVIGEEPYELRTDQVGRKNDLLLTVKTNSPVRRIKFPAFIPISYGDMIKAYILKADTFEKDGQTYYVGRGLKDSEYAEKIEIIKDGFPWATYLSEKNP
jgi:hypothetical protein